jgi:voltage-gated potassium channel Kch
VSAERIVLIGSGHLADAAGRALEAGGAQLERLHEPSDPEVREALAEEADSVVVISRSDVLSLRLALAVAHVSPGTRLLVTIFGRDVAEHLRDIVDNVHVLSMADIVAPAYVGPCLNPDLLSLTRTADGVSGIRAEEGKPRLLGKAWGGPTLAGRLRANLGSLVKPFDPSAQILVGGLVGFFAVFLADVLVTMAVGGLSLVEAFYTVAKVTVTVGPSHTAETGPAWFKVFSGIAMLLTLAFAAVLTAGLVNRLVERRLTGVLGRAAVPRREHVVVVGLGQVGLRVCEMLRSLGIPVVAIEQDVDAPNVLRAKREHIPVVIGSGTSQDLLRRVSIHRARAVAAVTSDELENIGVAVTAHGIRQDLAIALRAGDGDAATEVRSLFGIGVVRDVYRIAGTALAAVALGYDAEEAFPYEGTLYLVNDTGDIEPFVPAE